MVTLSEVQPGGGWPRFGDGPNTGDEGGALAQAAGLTSQGRTGLHGVSETGGPQSERQETQTVRTVWAEELTQEAENQRSDNG